jgi:23S rRNA (uracil1939-C5)-methyltransferase
MDPMDIRLEKIIAGGDAFGRAPDGRPVFVPFGAPGDLARVEITAEERGFLRGRILELLEPAPERVTPRCRHFGECGGCQLQHLSYAAQLHAKQEILREQLTRLGGLTEAPIRAIVPSPKEWNYRNHVQFSFARKGALGFCRAGSNTVLPIEECFLPETRLVELWKALDLHPFPGLRQLGLRAADDGEMIVFESDTGETPEFETEAEISAALLGPRGNTTYLAGGPMQYRILGRDFAISAGSFFQVNTALIPAMIEMVLEFAAPQPGDTALDLYCGAGLFGAFLAEKCAALIGVEESPSAVADFERNLDSFDNVELYAAEVEQALESIARRVDLAVVDPPRAGMAPRAMRGLLRLAPRRIVMISCDPATLARDGHTLAQAGWKLQAAVPFDLFPQTCHLETISLWVKE